jgi:two-component system, NtrC family, response regulator AtoC
MRPGLAFHAAIRRMTATVLIIDDEATLARYIATYLKRSGYDACVAASGEEGLALFADANPDAVLLDFALPGIDGLDVLKAIKSTRPTTAVILMTAQGHAGLAAQALGSGAADYLTKPVRLSDLRVRLAALIRR